MRTTMALTSDGPFDSPDRTAFTSRDIIYEIWRGLNLPEEALKSVQLPGENSTVSALPSSFKIGALAQASIALSALAAAQVYACRNKSDGAIDTPSSSIPAVSVPIEHAAVDFKSEQLYTLDGKTPSAFESSMAAIGGLHKTSDGHVRVHATFPNHANGILKLVGLDPTDGSISREVLADKLFKWKSIDVENAATVDGALAAYALRSFEQWDALPQSRAINSSPIDITKLPSDGPKGFPARMLSGITSTAGEPLPPSPSPPKCLHGLRVVEMSRVIAAPLSGMTLAAHGADVVWVTSPNLPSLPSLDRNFARGKRTVHIDLDDPSSKQRLLDLLSTCDVFIQGYRPESLAAKGLSPDALVAANPSIIVANMSAFGPRGLWSKRRGFDSLVQTCTGMNVSEAKHAGKGEVARPMPCQALDHSAGYMLATAVAAAVYKRAIEGGAWRVDVSLAGMMKYLRSLGQYPGGTGFTSCEGIFGSPEKGGKDNTDFPEDYFETKQSGFGSLRAVTYAASVEGCSVGWDIMPKPLGSDNPEWLQ